MSPLPDRRLFCALADEIDGLVAVLDRDLRYVLVNGRAAERAGVPADEVPGRPLDEIVPSHAEVIASAVRPVLESGTALHEVPFRTRGPDGRPVTWRGDLVPVLDDHGVVEHVIVVLRDLSPLARSETRRALAEAKLAIAELGNGAATGGAGAPPAQPGLEGMTRALDMLFEGSTVGMLMVGFDGRIQRVNLPFARLVQREVADLMGAPVQDLTHADDVRATEQRLAAGPELQQFEKRYLTPEGAPVWVRITSWLVRDDEGAPVSNLGIAVPIGGAKAVEGTTDAAPG